MPLLAGKVLGGSSSINGMLYLRGSTADYDQWSTLGAEGWNYSQIFPYFLKSEDNHIPEYQNSGKNSHETLCPKRVKSPNFLYPVFPECSWQVYLGNIQASQNHTIVRNLKEPEPR